MHESKHVLPGQFAHCILLTPLFSILLCVVFSDIISKVKIEFRRHFLEEGKNYVYLFVFCIILGEINALQTGTKAFIFSGITLQLWPL
jgi:hypothetical protein